MKKIFFLVLAFMATISLSAQMTVWSNGHSVYNSAVENVDSISFNAAAPGYVVNQEAQVTSLEGKVYLYHIGGKTFIPSSSNALTPTVGLGFYSATEGVYFVQTFVTPQSGGTAPRHFTYSISYPSITVNLNGSSYQGKIIGNRAIVFEKFLAYNGNGESQNVTFFIFE